MLEMNWFQFISGIYDQRNLGEQGRMRPDFRSPATLEEIALVQSQLNVQLPAALAELLLQTDGIMDMLEVDGHWIESMWLIDPAEEILKTNQFFRAEQAKGTYERDFTDLLFFAGAGADGILFAHPVTQRSIADSKVVYWDPIDDELTEVAPSLQLFVEGWLNGSITV